MGFLYQHLGFVIGMLILVIFSVLISSSSSSTLQQKINICSKRNPMIFSFGDSNTDTGGLVAGLGYNVNLPNGRSFFRSSTGRLSYGRSSTLLKSVPFALNIQIMQFQHLKNRSFQLATTKGSRKVIDDDGFKNALYYIDIGQNNVVHTGFRFNDLADTFRKNVSYARVVKRIPEIKDAVKVCHDGLVFGLLWTIYDEGGKHFWIHNTGPLGFFNDGLRALCAELRTELKGTTIVYADIYNLKYDLIVNSKKYGIKNPLMACFGHGGSPYNYNASYICGHPKCGVCEEGAKFISWDGTHYTEAANTIVASNILSKTHSTPNVKFDYFCNA
ncbi:hypothetical protein MKX01_010112 [Papaver californicum]|nr:hypothetical protein MKX01_010112 [Papaver californicum]